MALYAVEDASLRHIVWNCWLPWLPRRRVVYSGRVSRIVHLV